MFFSNRLVDGWSWRTLLIFLNTVTKSTRLRFKKKLNKLMLHLSSKLRFNYRLGGCRTSIYLREQIPLVFRPITVIKNYLWLWFFFTVDYWIIFHTYNLRINKKQVFFMVPKRFVKFSVMVEKKRFCAKY